MHNKIIPALMILAIAIYFLFPKAFIPQKTIPVPEVRTITFGINNLNNYSSPENPILEKITKYSLPKKIEKDNYALSGLWKFRQDYIEPQKGSAISIDFTGKQVSTNFDFLSKDREPVRVHVLLDSVTVGTQSAGIDLLSGRVDIDKSGKFQIINLPSKGRHVLRLEFLNKGLLLKTILIQ